MRVLSVHSTYCIPIIPHADQNNESVEKGEDDEEGGDEMIGKIEGETEERHGENEDDRHVHEKEGHRELKMINIEMDLRFLFAL